MMRRFYVQNFTDQVRKEFNGEYVPRKKISHLMRMKIIEELCVSMFGFKSSKHVALMKYLVMKRMDFEEFMVSHSEFHDLIVPINDCLYTYTNSKLSQIIQCKILKDFYCKFFENWEEVLRKEDSAHKHLAQYREAIQEIYEWFLHC